MARSRRSTERRLLPGSSGGSIATSSVELLAACVLLMAALCLAGASIRHAERVVRTTHAVQRAHVDAVCRLYEGAVHE